MATAVAIRATVATNIAQPALRKKPKGILRMTKALANKIKTKRATKRESFVKVLKTQMKIATAVAIRATAATNIAQAACEKNKKLILPVAKALANKKQTKQGTARE